LKSALQEYLESRVFGDYTINPTTLNLTNTWSQVLNHNYERMNYCLVNVGNTTIYLQIGRLIPTVIGIALFANGGFMSVNARDDYAMVGIEVWGMALGSGSVINCWEIIRYGEGK
jgi:hypothetical protein